MKFQLKTAVLLASALVFVCPRASVADESQAEPLGITTAVGVYSDYMFRGKNVYEGTSIQPSATGSYDFGEFGSFAANVWLQVPGESNEPPQKYNELDTTLSYGYKIDNVNLTIGHIFYTFPGGDGRFKDTLEVFGGVSIDMLLHPSFTIYDDYDQGDYQYYTLGLKEGLPEDWVGKDVHITPYALFGFASNANDPKDGFVIYRDNGLEHVDVGVSVDVAVGRMMLSPNLNYTFAVDDATHDEFWFGIDASLDILPWS